MDPTQFDRVSKLFAARRLSRRKVVRGAGVLAAGAAGTAGLVRAASAQDATPPAPLASPAAGVGGDADHPSFLFVQSFGEGSIAAGENGNLTLTADHLTGQTLYFSDRPERIVGTVSTEKFLGLDRAKAAPATPPSGVATPEGGIGFAPVDPPNAALVFDSAKGSDDPGDVVVVELINPVYDPSSGQATYEIKVLADDTAVDMTLVSEPVSSADAIRAFDGASLFIDDCPDGSVTCVEALSPTYSLVVGSLPIGYCWNWGSACCQPCSEDFGPLCLSMFGAGEPGATYTGFATGDGNLSCS